MPGKPPLGLHAEVTLANGSTYRWDGNARSAGDRPQAISFRTKKGDGFADGQLTLSRRIDQDYVDLNLYDDFALVGFDGSVAYEGRVAALPRTLSDQSHQVGVVLQGWMSHAKDRKFSEVYVERDTSKWGDAELTEYSRLAGTVELNAGYSWSVDHGGLVCSFPAGQAISTSSQAETWYVAPSGCTIAKVMYIGQDSGTALGAARFLFSTASDYTTGSAAAVAATLDSTLRTATAASARRYVVTDISPGAITPAAGTIRRITAVGLYGNHGLTTRSISSTVPDGVYASDVITNVVQRFCPRLSTAGVQATSYAIPHLVFERAFPYDAFLEVNKFHLWNLAVYENKTLYFQPFDYSDYDWEVRRSDPGVTADLQGDSVGDFFNGISVTYDDVDTGRPATITPDDDATLLDPSPTNPANVQGLKVWTETTISTPTTAAGAVNHARAVLAETNQPKAPGTIRITGHVRDRAGHWQQVWKMRAGQRLIISDHPNDAVRIIGETDYNHDSKTVSIAVDQSFMRVDAVQDRIATALQAANLI